MTQSQWDRVRARALALPRTIEDFPWGESVVKIDYPQRKGADGLAVGPMFVWLGRPERATVSVKLAASYEEAVSIGGATPTTMSGLGKWGWLTIPLGNVDLGLLSDWLEESYRSVAPKRLLAELMTAQGKGASRTPGKRRLPGGKQNRPDRNEIG